MFRVGARAWNLHRRVKRSIRRVLAAKGRTGRRCRSDETALIQADLFDAVNGFTALQLVSGDAIFRCRGGYQEWLGRAGVAVAKRSQRLLLHLARFAEPAMNVRPSIGTYVRA
jgi:hypothetical protein